MICSVEICARKSIALTLCSTHYQRLKNAGDVRADEPIEVQRSAGTACRFGGCGTKPYVKELCRGHYSQQRLGRDLTPIIPRRPNGSGVVVDGYHLVVRNGKRIGAHRIVMEEMLGRVLLPGENVHHKNGVRDDNRPENLELWVTSQPSGQRVPDLLEWAHEICRRYE